MIEKRQYTCHLLTDVILNIKSASEGNNSTLDFIPGNCFLGIVARTLYQTETDALCGVLFHSGNVRFGDAHPLWKGVRSVRIPAIFYKPKLEAQNGGLYVHSQVNHKEKLIRELQLKQCREGFYVFDNDIKKGEECKQERNFAIKSAYDKERLCSKDECMFGYESLQSGADFAFDIEIDECVQNKAELWTKIENALVGIRSIGRSRTAQYGRVAIKQENYREQIASIGLAKEEVFVYADARLIFLDKYGIPTFRPTADDLGVQGGEILWDKCQIRTFQYAPWNAKRRAFDMDRCGIEKGSVFVVKSSTLSKVGKQYVGCYRNEGFGSVIYNPAFLLSEENGKSVFTISKNEESASTKNQNSLTQNTPLIKYLERQKQLQESNQEIYKSVNDFRNKNKSLFEGEVFASQWGSIRALAMKCRSYEEMIECLFGKDEVNGHKKGYLVHGVAEDKWKQRDRRKILEEFLKVNHGKKLGNDVELLINLASEMQKIV